MVEANVGAAPDLAGGQLGQYDIKERIGFGGSSSVYRAVQRELGREVALKVLSPAIASPEFVERFRNEARVLARLDHPNILPIYDFGSEQGVTYFTMPLVRGGSLADLLVRGRPPLDFSWRALRQVADALDHAHLAGVIHRDLKPSNVLLYPDGRVVICDFGLSRSIDVEKGLTADGLAVGTPGYMAPEQATGQKADARTDVYALAVLAFELLTGTPPYVAPTPVEVMALTISAPVPAASSRNSELPPLVDAVISWGMSKDQASRPRTAREFIEHLSGKTATPMPGSSATMQPVAPPSRQTASAVNTLVQMGLPRLRAERPPMLVNSYLQQLLQGAQIAGEEYWLDIARAAGVASYSQFDASTRDQRMAPGRTLAQLASAFDQVCGPESNKRQAQWGRATMELALKARRSSGYQRRGLSIVPGSANRLRLVLNSYANSLDEAFGTHLHAWKQIDQRQFWLVHYQNPLVAGRVLQEKACDFWVASLDTMIRWANLGNEWSVEEVECGGVVGTGDCLFVIRSLAPVR